LLGALVGVQVWAIIGGTEVSAKKVNANLVDRSGRGIILQLVQNNKIGPGVIGGNADFVILCA
jgi:hypothetical protein